MRTIGIPSRFWTLSVAALGAALTLAVAPAPAQAEVCGDFDDIAEDLLGIYLDQFEGLLDLSEKTCDAMTKTFYSACTTAIKDAAKCWDRQLKSIQKAAKPACNEGAKNPSDCYQFYKDEVKDEGESVDEEANSAKSDCNFAADDFYDACRDLVF